MGVLKSESSLAGLRWLTLSGAREEVFRGLGALCRAEILAVQNALPERDGLAQWAMSLGGEHRVEQLWKHTSDSHPEALLELKALAEGAGMTARDLFLANVRGDVGVLDATGCTDLLWSRRRSFAAHNEDGAPGVGDHLMFLSLHITGEQPVAVQWYPGFLPSNAFVVTQSGLVWGIDHLPISRPGSHGGRHFVARGLQQAETIDEASAYLASNPMAGGFCINLSETGTGRMCSIESAAGHVAGHTPDDRHPLLWHTNHARLLPATLTGDAAWRSAEDGATAQLGHYGESLRRGDYLSQIALPDSEPDVAWFRHHLTDHGLPDGVHRTAAGDDPLMTLCTTIADLDSGYLTIITLDGGETTLGIDRLVAGC